MIRSRGAIVQKKVALEITAISDLEGKIYSWHSGIPRKMTELELKEAEEGRERKEEVS
jgi:hypothetical protein